MNSVEPLSECYCCSRPATTREHVPPECFFPEQKDLPGVDFRKSLIVVPSCEEHNTKKSKDDEYLMYVINMTIDTNNVSRRYFATKIMRAINRRPIIINRLLSDSRKVRLKNVEGLKIFDTHAIHLEYDRVESSFTLMAKALYFFHYGKKWIEDVEIHTDFVFYSEHENSNYWNDVIHSIFFIGERLFRDVPPCGENPKIFNYQFYNKGPENPAMLRMTFYEGVHVIAIFGELPDKLFGMDFSATFWFRPSLPLT